MARGTDGDILCIDKPTGMTSFDVIRRLRAQLGVRKIGHAGTLDPAASGLLILGVGSATKRLHELTGLDKTYEVTARIGEARDTGDMDGAVVATDIPDTLAQAAVREVLAGMVGTLELPVPRYAAVKQGGVPLYKRARRGEEFTPPVRAMDVHDIELRACWRGDDGFWHLALRMDVASGVYVRSIVEEIGRRLGYPAVTETLRRTSVGEYSIEDAQALEDLV